MVASSPTLVLKWYNEFDNLGHFKLDERGLKNKEWISGDDLLHVLLAHLKTEKRVTVSKVVDFVNSKLLTEEHTFMSEARMKGAYGIVRPVSRALVHSWMTKADCVLDRATQTYYTDVTTSPR